MTKRIIISLVVISAFILADQIWEIHQFLGLTFSSWSSTFINIYIKIAWYCVFPISILALLYGYKRAIAETGLKNDIALAAKVTFLCTLPMLIGYAWMSHGTLRFDLLLVLTSSLLPALSEELLFRGFLFGQLHRRAGWAFVPAALLSAVVFGFGHLYQGHNTNEIIGIFLVTGIGGMWFSWLYKSWNYNLWIPLGFHFFMNLWWTIFSAGDTALGGWSANVFRAVTIILSVIATLQYQKRQQKAEIEQLEMT